MDHTAAPSDLVAALLTAGYRVVGPVGVGADGPAWSAVALDGPPDRVVVRPVDLGADPRHRARLARLRTVQHEHLARVRDVIEVGPDRCALLVDHLAGPTLEALRHVRGPLSSGEAVTLVVPLADALEALHAAGLVHGDVSPANVVIRLDGRPVLVDLIGCLTGSAGTPGFAAPEVERGDECGPAADVYALATVVLAQLAPDDGEPGTRGTAAWSDARRIRGLLTGAADPDPQSRLGARDLADACFRAHEPEPIVLPDAAVLARAELSLLAGRPVAEMTRRHSSRHRGRRAWIAPVARVLAGGAAIAVCVGIVVAVGRLDEGGRAGPGRAGATTSADVVGGEAGVDRAGVDQVVADGTDPAVGVGVGADAESPGTRLVDTQLVDAARGLTQRRAEILAGGDPRELEQIEVAGSPAHVSDTALLDELGTRGLRIDGLSVTVSAAWVVDAGADGAGVEDGAAPDRARVAVTSSSSEYRRVSGDGTVEAVVPAGQPRTVELVLRRAGDVWLVEEVRAAGAQGVSSP